MAARLRGHQAPLTPRMRCACHASLPHWYIVRPVAVQPPDPCLSRDPETRRSGSAPRRARPPEPARPRDGQSHVFSAAGAGGESATSGR